MKLHLLNRASSKDSSFSVAYNRYPNFLKIWHHHPELELVVIQKSTGTRFIGDSIEKFGEGEVILIGAHLPHMWLNDEIYFDPDSHLIAEALGIHFRRDFLGGQFFDTPEMQSISKLIERARQGIKFIDVDPDLIRSIEDLANVEGFEKTMQFLNTLFLLAKHKNFRLLASTGYVNTFNRTDGKNLDVIYAYIFKNFKNPIHSKDVAGVAHMNASAFSRFFKRVHRKTFTKYLNEIRVGYACKLLMEQKSNVSLVCYESGFNNISNFNRQFKSIMHMSPTEYIRLHAQ
ncbi:AraC family transcriptional regulator [Kriegella aquimaris]|uniref:Transcriptional regulator, AraC family n=1 Tax=Kriegella aquimaris TaxID=192904 RepID=A0A1G9R8N0_9FLAO|nr:AraC family transcriptional regulator [Kriegella aquimaris]SDM19480.1 transcriptional regulator, AraC family [Kriegella aquimaris]